MLPGAFEDPVEVELSAVELEKAPLYEAISYAWGDLSLQDSKAVTCRGASVPVTVNLFDALRRFRYESSPRMLWADAVCIDQSNLTERGSQVNIMGYIFSHAAKVLVWLGEDEHSDTAAAFDLIADVNRHFEAAYLQLDATLRADPAPATISLEPLPEGSPLLTPTRWQAFSNLLSRPWFSRVWVLQEVGLAKTAVAFVGASSILLSEIVQTCLLY